MTALPPGIDRGSSCVKLGMNRLVYVILAEDRLVLAEAQAPQPDHDVHNVAPTLGLPGIMVLPRGVSSWSQCDRARQPAGSTPYLN
jgi:hypothetical protein